MINLLPITKVISFFCAIYAILISIIFVFTGNHDIANNIVASVKYATVFEFIILLTFMYWWRGIWKLVPKLNYWVFPDINGIWDVEIHWQWRDKTGIKEGKAHIKQDFIKMSMEFLTDESESETLVIRPKRDPESGRPQLFYIYRNFPKYNSPHTSSPHTGAAILKFDPTNISALEGNYFTDRNTKGMFKLSSIKENT